MSKGETELVNTFSKAMSKKFADFASSQKIQRQKTSNKVDETKLKEYRWLQEFIDVLSAEKAG